MKHTCRKSAYNEVRNLPHLTMRGSTLCCDSQTRLGYRPIAKNKDEDWSAGISFKETLIQKLSLLKSSIWLKGFYLFEPSKYIEDSKIINIKIPAFQNRLFSCLVLVITLLVLRNPGLCQEPHYASDANSTQVSVTSTYIVTLRTGLNLISYPFSSYYDSNMVIDSIYKTLMRVYEHEGLSFNMYVNVLKYYPDEALYKGFLGVGNESGTSATGEILLLNNKDESFLLYLKLTSLDSRSNFPSISISFISTEEEPVTDKITVKPGINFLGFSGFPLDYDISRIIKDPNYNRKVISIAEYGNKTGEFEFKYLLFGRPAGNSLNTMRIKGYKGYILFSKEGLDIVP